MSATLANTSPIEVSAPYEPLLVRAATAAPADAVAAWGTFLASHRIDEVGDAEAQRLLSTVYHRLVEARAPDTTPELARLAGVFRRTWVLNQQAAAALIAAVDLLDEADIEALAGPFTAAALGGDLGCVEAGVPTLLVAPDHVRRARAVLGNRAVSVGCWPSPWMMGSRGPQASWSLLVRCTRTSKVGGRDLPVLDPTTALVAVVTAGLAPGSSIRLRWAVVAAEAIAGADDRTGPAIDGERLVELAGHFEVGPVVRDALTWIARDLRVPVDPDLAEGLARFESQRPACERLGRARRGPFPQLRAEWGFTRRRLGLTDTLASIPTFLVERWALTSNRQIPGELADRARQRLGLAVGGPRRRGVTPT